MSRNHKARKVIDKTIRRKIIKLFNSGKSSIKIGKELDLCSTTVLDYLHKLGIDPNRGKKKLVIADILERKMVKLWGKGLNGLDISRKLKIPSTTVYFHLKKYVDTTHNGKYLPYKVTDEMRSEMLNLWKSGLSCGETARKLNITKDAVIDNLRKLNIDTSRYANIPIPQVTKSKIKHLYKEGYSTMQIGKILNISDWTVRKYLRRMGIDPGLHHRAPNKVNKGKLWEKIISLWHKGIGTRLIAKNLGLAKSTVLYHLHKHKVNSGRNFEFDVGLLQEKYDSMKLILIKLFSINGYDILKVANYSTPGPDILLLDSSNRIIPVEFKAEMCTGTNFGKGLRQIISYVSKLNSPYGFLVTTADKTNLYIPSDIKMIWSNELYEAFPEHKKDLDIIRFVSTKTPKISN